MFCPNCGTPLEDIAVFCSSCGTRIKENSEATSAEKDALSEIIGKKAEKKVFSFDYIAVITGLFVAIITATVLVGSAVAANRPEKIAMNYLKSYYLGEIRKADSYCITTMKDQWEQSIEKYHNGNKKAYFMFLTTSYEGNVTSFSSAYKSFGKMTYKRFADYYGDNYNVETVKTQPIELNEHDAFELTQLIVTSEYADKLPDRTKLSDEVMKIRVTLFIDGDSEGKTVTNDINLIKYDGRWKVINPLIYGW